jgi:hypothetical protein
MGLTRRAEQVRLRQEGGAMADEPGAAFRRSGDSWELAYRGRRVSVRDSKGMRDLAVLLARPGREVHALDLVRLTEGTAGERSVPHGDLGEVLDDRARDAYRQRLATLDAMIDEADELGHNDAADRARDERAAIVAELAGAYGLGGRPRRTGDPAERARSTVTWRIRDAIARIDKVHPELGSHLRTSVRTGTYCRYEPESKPGWVM